MVVCRHKTILATSWVFIREVDLLQLLFCVLYTLLFKTYVACLFLTVGRRGRSVDYLFVSPFNERPVSYEEALHLIRAPRARLPTDHPVGYEYESLVTFERELHGEVSVG